MRDLAKTETARRLRREATAAERQLWEVLRGRRLDGFKFVRQAPAGPFVADFLCREHWLVVEVDGETHRTADELAAEARRSGYLKRDGYRVLRLRNEDVLDGMDGVMAAIAAALKGV